MERLTKEGKFCDVIECELTPGGSFCERGTCTERRLWERLSSIEDILGDDYDLDRLRVIINQRMSMRDEVAKRFEITKDIPLDRLRELVEADRGGRCVVLPCEVGSTVYMMFCNEIIEKRVGQFHVNGYTTPRIWADIDCDWGTTQKVRWDLALGKTVFLTRKAAEAALKGEKDG
ncbi:hypothetical protein WGC32_14305 [Zongyangia sp. HA2173]|uniref:hypothetical protein n=1 Tax=Zongyangia sp. HA2173 TaxID=3133035 RepID=UPI003162FBE4